MPRGSQSLLSRRVQCPHIGLLPVMVDRRLALTAMVLDSLKQLSADPGVTGAAGDPHDSAVPKAARVRKFWPISSRAPGLAD